MSSDVLCRHSCEIIPWKADRNRGRGSRPGRPIDQYADPCRASPAVRRCRSVAENVSNAEFSIQVDAGRACIIDGVRTNGARVTVRAAPRPAELIEAPVTIEAGRALVFVLVPYARDQLSRTIV